jgi:FAD/FMN-containing dehydrogenase
VTQPEHWTTGLARLETDVRGQVLTAGSEDYDESRRVFNAMIDRYPAVIVRCAEVADVVLGVEFARQHGLPVSVKGGGHSVAGSAVSDFGLTFDMAAMTRIVVDPVQRTAVARNWKSSFLRQLPAETIGTVLRHLAQAPSPHTVVGLQQMTGVASRVDPAATAFAHRAEQYVLILSQWDDPADSPDNTAWTRALFEAMQPFLEPSVYMNNLGDEGPTRVRAAYGTNDDRLAQVKATYDPDNLFRFNPTSSPPRHRRRAVGTVGVGAVVNRNPSERAQLLPLFAELTSA